MGIKGLVVSNAMFKKIALKWQAISARKIALPALDQLRDVMAKMGRYDEMQMIWHQEHHVNHPFSKVLVVAGGRQNA